MNIDIPDDLPVPLAPIAGFREAMKLGKRRLEEAADYITEHGWTRQVMEGPKGTVCVLGALDKVYNAHTDEGILPNYIAIQALRQYTGAWSVARWNDEVARSGRHAVRTMREAAEAISVPEEA